MGAHFPAVDAGRACRRGVGRRVVSSHETTLTALRPCHRTRNTHGVTANVSWLGPVSLTERQAAPIPSQSRVFHMYALSRTVAVSHRDAPVGCRQMSAGRRLPASGVSPAGQRRSNTNSMLPEQRSATMASLSRRDKPHTRATMRHNVLRDGRSLDAGRRGVLWSLVFIPTTQSLPAHAEEGARDRVRPLWFKLCRCTTRLVAEPPFV